MTSYMSKAQEKFDFSVHDPFKAMNFNFLNICKKYPKGNLTNK